MAAYRIPTDIDILRPIQYQDTLSIQNMQVLVGPVTHRLSPIITHFFLDCLFDYYIMFVVTQFT